MLYSCTHMATVGVKARHIIYMYFIVPILTPASRACHSNRRHVSRDVISRDLVTSRHVIPSERVSE